MLCEDFQELHGDRQFNDDRALVGGPAFFDGRAVMIVAQQKGRDTKEKIARNFGMPQPEGYRKALRLMKMAEKFDLPLLTFIDTREPFRAWVRRSAMFRRRSPSISGKCPFCGCRRSRWWSARAARAARSSANARWAKGRWDPSA